jgi:hypothetical protein
MEREHFEESSQIIHGGATVKLDGSVEGADPTGHEQADADLGAPESVAVALPRHDIGYCGMPRYHLTKSRSPKTAQAAYSSCANTSLSVGTKVRRTGSTNPITGAVVNAEADLPIAPRHLAPHARLNPRQHPSSPLRPDPDRCASARLTGASATTPTWIQPPRFLRPSPLGQNRPAHREEKRSSRSALRQLRPCRAPYQCCAPDRPTRPPPEADWGR